MNNNRFKLRRDSEMFTSDWSIIDEHFEKCLCEDEIVDYLNSLHEENIKLTQKIDFLERIIEGDVK